jgi:glucosamine--fructose-6-phosphate aminotransferase (isomerizing)
LVDPYIQELQMNLDRNRKEVVDHFMLKEIYEQPGVAQKTHLSRKTSAKNGRVIQMLGVEDNLEENF